MWNRLHDFDHMFMTNSVPHRLMSRGFDACLRQSRGNSKPLLNTGCPVNLYDNEKTFSLHALLPGVEKEDVEIHIKGRVLEIAAKRSVDIPEGYKVTRRERPVFDFKKQFTLPTDVDADGIEAHLEDGVLQLIIPKSEVLTPQKIAINQSK